MGWIKVSANAQGSGGRPSKSLETLYRPTLHLVGCWLHGFLLLFWISNEDFKKNSCTQLEHLFNGLSSILDSYTDLPLVLHLQQDNCGREGKNQYVLAAMCLLVLLRIFNATTCAI